MTTNSAKTTDPIVTAAIHRIAATRFPNSQAGEVAAYECTMTLPKQFKDDAAELVVRKIIERSVGYKQDKFNKLLGKFKG